MKKSKMICAVLAAAMLAGCAANTKDNETAEEVLQSPTIMTTTETTMPTEITTEQTTTAAEQTTVSEVSETEDASPVNLSLETEFIDYKFIENYEGTKDIGELADKAVDFVKSGEIYKKTMADFNTLLTEGKLVDPDTETQIEYDDFISRFSDYISNDVIEPVLIAAYPNDYDGDGKEEAYIIVEMPERWGYGVYFGKRDLVIFSDKDQNMEIVDEISDMYPPILLDYGSFKQITIGGSGSCGAEDHTCIYGVQDGKSVKLYFIRGSFCKEDCFLSTFGWQGSGDFMYFDTVKQRYVSIKGVDVPLDEIRKMDTAGDLTDDLDNNRFFAAQLIGGKYYCFIEGMMDYGTVYTYENNAFLHMENSNVRISTNECELEVVTDINIDEAVASMKHID